MLKISIIEHPAQRQLIVEGKLVGPWVGELRSASEKAKADLRGRELVLDMTNLTAISQEGENVLLELMSEGIEFRRCGVLMKHILKQLTRRATRNLRETKQ